MTDCVYCNDTGIDAGGEACKACWKDNLKKKDMSNLEKLWNEVHALQVKLEHAKTPIERSYLMGLIISMDDQIKLLNGER